LTQVAGPLLAFALLVIVAGAVNPGYAHSRDHVSNLASRGAGHAWIGMLAIASFAAAHAGAALLWRRVAPAVWIALLTCSGFGLLTTLARTSCPGGAADCSLSGTESASDLWDLVHGLAVGAYEVSFVIAGACAGVVLLRSRRPWPGALVLVLAVLSFLTLGRSDEQVPGTAQRIWLAVSALGLLAMAAFAARAVPRDPTHDQPVEPGDRLP